METASISPLPPGYETFILFVINGMTIRFKGGRAMVLDHLIAAGPAGIDRATTLRWVANLADTIAALRAKGIDIETRKRRAANYALLSDVRRIGGAA